MPGFSPPNYYGNDSFFRKEHCDRCGKKLDGRTMSWFNSETICLECSAEEDKIKQRLRERGRNPSVYEGCGYIPTI